MEAGFLLLFFLATLGAITVAGYVIVLRGEKPGAIAVATGNDKTARETLRDTLHDLGKHLPRTGQAGTDLRKLLIAAGHRAPEAPLIFNGICYATAVTFGLIAGFLAALVAEPADVALGFVCGAGFGYLLPKRVLEQQMNARRRRLASGLPTALDLLVLSVEAGQALDQAILDTSRELRKSYPDLADEFLNTNLALRTSTSREEVFREFGSRSREPELKKLASLLIDSDRLGTSLAPTLRTHARYLRVRRRQLAQERARKVSVKLVFPIFFLVFPSVMLVTLGPAVIQISRSMGHMLAE
jgi:tight adherence protein C